VSSRQQEKERRRREREEREATVRRQAAGRRRLQLVAGGVLAVAAVVAVAVAILGGGGNSKSSADAKLGTAAIPGKQISDFNDAVKAAGCEYKSYPSEGRTHLPSDTATFNKYKTNPPTSGTHRPIPAEDGVYAPNNPPAKENAVHALEHGRIEIEYAPGTSRLVERQLNTLVNEPLKGVAGYHQLLFQNNTNMPYQVAAVAWTQLLGCKTMNPKVFDAIRAFRDRFVDKGPELIP
jgi:Protein of unknown function (DUF3105)